MPVQSSHCHGGGRVIAGHPRPSEDYCTRVCACLALNFGGLPSKVFETRSLYTRNGIAPNQKPSCIPIGSTFNLCIVRNFFFFIDYGPISRTIACYYMPDFVRTKESHPTGLIVFVAE
jgi:hypothetical protein